MTYQLHENEQFLSKTPWRDVRGTSVVTYASPLIASKQKDDSYLIILSRGQYDKTVLYSVKDEDKLNNFRTKVHAYEQHLTDILDIELSGTKIINEQFSIKIEKNCEESNIGFEFILMDSENRKCGSRVISINPFLSYLKLGVFTVSGSSSINKELIGKGCGKALYDTVDKILPYHQIPHGYADAIGGLSNYSREFWKKREKYIMTPPVDENVAKTLKKYKDLRINSYEIHEVNEILRAYNVAEEGYTLILNGDYLYPQEVFPEKEGRAISLEELANQARNLIRSDMETVEPDRTFDNIEDFKEYVQSYHGFFYNAFSNHPLILEAMQEKYDELCGRGLKM